MKTTANIRLTSLALILIPALAAANETTALQQIMQGLRDSLVEITDGLLTDDFELVQRGAIAIAEHPQIPANQVPLVAAELGTEMPAFKQLDTRVHNLSLEIRRAAETLDRDKAITAYQQLVDGCFACHIAYKDRVATALGSTD